MDAHPIRGGQLGLDAVIFQIDLVVARSCLFILVAVTGGFKIK